MLFAKNLDPQRASTSGGGLRSASTIRALEDNDYEPAAKLERADTEQTGSTHPFAIASRSVPQIGRPLPSLIRGCISAGA